MSKFGRIILFAKPKELLGILQKKRNSNGSKDVKNQQEKYCDTQNKIQPLRLLKLVDYE